MDFLNDLGKRFTRVARSVQERTREGWESTRLSRRSVFPARRS